MARLAITSGIPTHDIFNEECSKDTFGNAVYTRLKIIDFLGLQNFGVITTDFHIPRARLCFRKAFGSGYNIEYLGVTSSFSGEVLKRVSELEERQLKFAKWWLKDITDGDVDRMEKLLLYTHPGYAKTPDFSVEELFAKISSF